MPNREQSDAIRTAVAEQYSFSTDDLDADSKVLEDDMQHWQAEYDQCGITKIEESVAQLFEDNNITKLPNLDKIYDGNIRRSFTKIIPDLESYDFRDITEDATIRDRLIEQNLDDALRYLQSRIALRREYGEIAKLYVDTSLKSEEFFRLNRIHKQEVKAGLYTNPYPRITERRRT